MKPPREAAPVHAITDATRNHTVDMRKRMIEYGVAMGIRAICLVLVFVVDGWWKLIPILGAVFLPFFAVMFANAGADTSTGKGPNALIDQLPQGEIEAPQGTQGEASPSNITIEGEVIENSAGKDA